MSSAPCRANSEAGLHLVSASFECPQTGTACVVHAVQGSLWVRRAGSAHGEVECTVPVLTAQRLLAYFATRPSRLAVVAMYGNSTCRTRAKQFARTTLPSLRCLKFFVDAFLHDEPSLGVELASFARVRQEVSHAACVQLAPSPFACGMLCTVVADPLLRQLPRVRVTTSVPQLAFFKWLFERGHLCERTGNIKSAAMRACVRTYRDRVRQRTRSCRTQQRSLAELFEKYMQ